MWIKSRDKNNLICFTITAGFIEPFLHVLQSVHSRPRPLLPGLPITRIEKVVRLSGPELLPPVVPDIEHLGPQTEPGKVTTQFTGNVSFTTCW